MRVLARLTGLFTLTVALVVLAFGASAALADTGNVIEPQNEPPTGANGWQAGTCKTDSPLCSPETPGQFFTQAAGHPPIGFTQYIIQHQEVLVPEKPPYPTGSVAPLTPPLLNRAIKTLRVDVPPGLTVNPEAAPRCSLADFERELEVEPGVEKIVPACDEASILGVEELTLATNEAATVEELELPSPPFPPPATELPAGFVIEPTPGLSKVPVYNLEPKDGEPALFGFVVAGEEVVFLETEVNWEGDFHQSFTIRPPEPEVPGLSTLISRLVNFGATAGDGSYINNPTTCFDPADPANELLYSTWYRAESYGEPDPSFPFGSTPFEAKVQSSSGQLIQQEGCDEVPFEPGIDVDPGTSEVDSPAGATVTTTLEYFDGEESTRQESHLRKAVVELPQGMALNPAAANGLVACTDAQFKKGVRTYDNECPAASRIGSAEIESPPLPPGSLKGDIYVGTQKSFDPASGEEFRTLIEAKSEQLGIAVRLVGNVSADPGTGQLTATFDEQETGELVGTLPRGLPQVPFESVKLHFDKGKNVLTSPPTCGPHGTTSSMEPWSAPGTNKHPSSSFGLTSAPGGGPCPQNLGQRPFNPGFVAGPEAATAGAYSPFRLLVRRPDGAQEIRQVRANLAPGMVARLKGVPYCPEANIAAAVGKSGAAEIAAPSCPASSLVGGVALAAGSGSTPFHTAGKVYLAGPYKNAPVSLLFVTPTVAGPFDLGTVVVRTALYVDPETAEIHAVSDPIPDVFGGVKLDIRAIDVLINRPSFTVNPTTCRRPFLIGGNIFGGGSNPANAASWFESQKGNLFGATNCRALKFKPKFYARISGGKKSTKRRAHPKFRAILEGRKGDANLRRAAFILPRATILDQSHIKTICTRVQLAASQCPKASIYGSAKATSPLLDEPLKGPVYLTSSDNELPDLLADLHGQVPIRLRGVISSRGARLKTVFEKTPDVAVDKFILNMKGGGRGLLINTRDLCARQTTGYLNLRAQNSRRMKSKNLRLNIPACRKGRR